MDNDILYFKIFFPISVYFLYSLIIIIAIGSFADDPVMFRNAIEFFGLGFRGIDLFRVNVIFKFVLIFSLLLPLIGIEETKKHLGPFVMHGPVAVRWHRHRFIIYLAVLIFVMTTTIMWTLRTITSATLKEYLELSDYSVGIDLVTNTMFVFFLLVAFVTLLALKWFDSEITSENNFITSSDNMDNKKTAGR